MRALHVAGVALLGLPPLAAQLPVPGARPVLRTSIDMVRVDAVVVDGKGHVVPDLTAEDFELLQDGARQAIAAVAFVRPAAEVNAGPPVPSLPPAVAGAAPIESLVGTAPIVYRTIAIVVDDLGLSFTSLNPTQRALHRFIDEQRQPGDLVAIIRTGQSQGALQQYTRDGRLLHAAVDAIRWNSFGRAPLSGLTSVELDPLERLRPAEAGAPGGFRASPDRLRHVYAALGTFGALRAVVDGAGTLPGRKSVVLISEGVQPYDVDVELNLPLEEATRQVIRRAAHANVAVHTIDPRGLDAGGFTAADNVAGHNARSLVSAGRRRQAILQVEQDSLRRLAEETGGLAVVNNNDLSGGLRRALDDQNGYDLLGYIPPKGTFERADRFHRLKVIVKRRNIKVRARPGFYGGPAQRTDSPMSSLFSPVESASIGLRLTPVLGRSADGETVVRLLLHIDASTLSFSKAADLWTTTLEISGRTVDTNGAVVDNTAWRYVIRAGDDEHARALAQGLLYRNQITVKRPGFYHIGVTVRDFESGTLGTASQFIEVPDLPGGVFTTSGLLVSGEGRADAGANGETLAALAGPAVRVVAPGMRLTYALEVYNVPPESRGPGLLPMSVELRLLRDGKEVLTRPAGHVTRPQQGNASVWGELDLPASLAPGAYLLEARAATTDAKGAFRVATQSTDLTVR